MQPVLVQWSPSVRATTRGNKFFVRCNKLWNQTTGALVDPLISKCAMSFVLGCPAFAAGLRLGLLCSRRDSWPCVMGACHCYVC